MKREPQLQILVDITRALNENPELKSIYGIALEKVLTPAFVDMIMPVMDGPSTIRELKKITPELRIIGMSGYAKNETLGKISEEDMKDFLMKPYTTEKILTTLEMVLHRFCNCNY